MKIVQSENQIADEEVIQAKPAALTAMRGYMKAALAQAIGKEVVDKYTSVSWDKDSFYTKVKCKFAVLGKNEYKALRTYLDSPAGAGLATIMEAAEKMDDNAKVDAFSEDELFGKYILGNSAHSKG